ncbi:MAG: HPr(Ser) kinase/phosphatase [Ruminococcus bromii]
MSVEFSVPLSQIAEALNLTEVYVAENYKETNISTVEINRPGLELTGYLEFFDNKRIQVLGNTEFSYLGRYGPEAQKMVIDSIFSFGPPAVIICRDIEPSNAILESAKLHKVSIFSTPQSTSDLTASLVQYLNKELAPRITRHGVLVEVYGEGCLLTGDSGVGKSETAIELIKRGHRLVADDAVEIRRTAQTTLYGQSPENIRHFIELRGIGIINARKLFGMGAIKLQEKIDMVINLEQWDSAKVYDRLGLDNEYMKILGVEVPTLTIPVKPGRNLAVIIEVAAMNNRQKKMGYNAARELLKNLGMAVEDLPPSPKVIVDTWE